MNYSLKTRNELINICKEKGIVKYTEMKKCVNVNAIENDNKKNKGQFYTTKSSYILEGFTIPPNIDCIIEPFAGMGDLIEWVKNTGVNIDVEAYDIESKHSNIIERDTLKNPPDYNNKWIITNPPYLARNKCDKKDIYDKYNTNDLYKCFITSVVIQNNCKGGIFIIPAGFFFSHRDIDIRCRNDFMKRYRIIKVKYFEETVFDDTTTTIVAFSFEKSEIELSCQEVEWVSMPSNLTQIFKMSYSNDWIIGGDIYNIPIGKGITVRRYVEGQKIRDNEQLTHMTLNALDSGKKDGRISLNYKKDYIYPAKDCSRTFATFCITGKTLSEIEQKEVCSEFNEYLEDKRKKTWSLFLPQFRESKEYARKRIPFELAYRILLHLINNRINCLAN